MRLEAASCFVLLLCFSKVTSAFTPSSICVDENGNRVDCPESDSGFYFGPEYGYQEGLPKSAGISYSSAYSPQEFSAIEESVDNYNRIGDKQGVHWISCHLQRNMHFRTILVPTTVRKVRTTWGIFGPTTLVTYEIIQQPRQVLAGYSFSFVWDKRAKISDVNAFDPSTGTAGYYSLSSLSDVPGLKKIINILPTNAEYRSGNCLASAYIIQGKGDNDPWNKPVIVSDGFDPKQRIAIQEIFENVNNSLAPNANAFIQTITDKGYDVVFVDYGNGGNDMVENARALLRVIEAVSEKSGSNNIMVGGYSMGGLLARVALLLGEKNNRPCMNRISRYLSIDAPHLGAQVNYDMQKTIIDKSNTSLTEPLDYLYYEKVAAVAFDLKSVAARQLLFSHAISGSTDHDGFFAFVKSMGDYPSKPKRYSIGDASWIWPYGTSVSAKKAASIAGTNLYVKDEDLFPGSYIDLWASGSGALPSPGLGAGLAINLGIAVFNFLNLTTVSPSSSVYGDSRYKPTHIPLYSALGISKDNFLQITAPNNQSDMDRIATAYSPFHKLYLVNFTSRPRHIDFDNDLADKVVKSIKAQDISGILQLLLD
jgi:pimeloyl-ACP methyl ester carboxylesterase